MDYKEAREQIIFEINEALSKVDAKSIDRLIDDILSSDRVFLTGVGRVYLSLQAFAKRLSHLGVEAYCVGDTIERAMTKKSLLIVGSGSGCSIVPVAIAKKAKEFGGKVVHIGSNPNGDVAQYSDYMVRIPTRTRLYLEEEMDSKQPMTSLFEQSLLLLGDAVSMLIIERSQERDLRSLWINHANLE